jgi:hypothetical protein
MKSFLLLFIMAGAAMFNRLHAQVSSLPSGKYETLTKNTQNKWERGDIIIIDETHYRLSSNPEMGEYKFSVTAQRIFFTSGPLRSIYARTGTDQEKPVIVLPLAENEQLGMKLPSDITGYYRQ